MAGGRSTGRFVAGLMLIGMGMLFLLAQFVGPGVLEGSDALFLFAAGGLFFAGMFLGGSRAAGLALPASIFGMLGLIALVQQTWGHYESWSYAWALIIVAVGIGKVICGWWGHNELSVQSGLRLAGIGMLIFLVFGGFFEFVVGFSGFDISSQIVWAGGLILLGLFLVIRSSGLLNRSR